MGGFDILVCNSSCITAVGTVVTYITEHNSQWIATLFLHIFHKLLQCHVASGIMGNNIDMILLTINSKTSSANTVLIEDYQGVWVSWKYGIKPDMILMKICHDTVIL